jgi:hypothetical protein
MAFLKQIDGIWIDMDTSEPADPQPVGKEPWLNYIVTGLKPLPADDAYVIDNEWWRSHATLEEYYGAEK